MQSQWIFGRAMLAASTVLAASALATGARAQQVGDIFYIAMENHNWTQPSSYTSTQPIFGNAAAPFINSLVTPGNPNAADVSFASNYTNVPIQITGSPSGAGAVHPSEPNYVWSEAGLTGARNDADPYAAGISNNTTALPSTNATTNIINAPSFSAQLQSAGLGWKSYQEDTQISTATNAALPKSQWTVPLTSQSGVFTSGTNAYNGSNQYNYAAKHDPQIFFTATNGSTATTPNTSPSNPEAKYYAPLQQLQLDLSANTVAKYNWITPDQYNDMHTSLTGGFTYNGTAYTGDAANIAQGDNFLSIVVPEIEASAAFKNNGEIVIWNDETEGDGTTTAGFTSMEIVISPLAKGNAYTNNIPYTHSSDLLTNELLTGQPCLADACNATPLTDLFVAGAIPAVPEPASLAVMASGLVALLRLRRRRGA
jgi:hypothetical protein